MIEEELDAAREIITDLERKLRVAVAALAAAKIGHSAKRFQNCPKFDGDRCDCPAADHNAALDTAIAAARKARQA